MSGAARPLEANGPYAKIAREAQAKAEEDQAANALAGVGDDDSGNCGDRIAGACKWKAAEDTVDAVVEVQRPMEHGHLPRCSSVSFPESQKAV
jgi:hypothetical protein